ncbi:hypothetical protein [Mycolicibacterium goodii]|uniref:hypothetical protein n=1 Tax=Mycolicibacterium goodii TaxID=134601 RepID=UPI00069D5635
MLVITAPKPTAIERWLQKHSVDGHDHGRHHDYPTRWTYFESALMSREMSRL